MPYIQRNRSTLVSQQWTDTGRPRLRWGDFLSTLPTIPSVVRYRINMDDDGECLSSGQSTFAKGPNFFVQNNEGNTFGTATGRWASIPGPVVTVADKDLAVLRTTSLMPRSLASTFSRLAEATMSQMPIFCARRKACLCSMARVEFS